MNHEELTALLAATEVQDVDPVDQETSNMSGAQRVYLEGAATLQNLGSSDAQIIDRLLGFLGVRPDQVVALIDELHEAEAKEYDDEEEDADDEGEGDEDEGGTDTAHK